MMKRQRRITKAYFNIARIQYAPLIQKLSLRIGIDGTQVEELKAQGVVELLKCMTCYVRSGSFITFFHGRLVGIFRHMRDAELRARRIQILPLDSLLNIAGSDCDMDSHMMTQECLEFLNNDERNVIMKLFFDEETMREVSDDLGIFVSTVCRMKKKAIDKMKQKCHVE